MKINQFLEQNKLNHDGLSLWAKKFSEVHLPTADWTAGTTLCGTPMLGNNYAEAALKEDREVCPECQELFEDLRRDDRDEAEANPFTQLCVWPATLVGKDNVEQFVKFIADTFYGTRVKYAEEITTLPDVKDGKAVPDTGGRNDLFFYVHSDDLGKFSIPRLRYGIRWWEDVLANGGGVLYPDSVLEKYKPAW